MWKAKVSNRKNIQERHHGLHTKKAIQQDAASPVACNLIKTAAYNMWDKIQMNLQLARVGWRRDGIW
jgi:hypothetical protein